MPINCQINFGDLEIESTKDYVKKKAAFNMLVKLYQKELLDH